MYSGALLYIYDSDWPPAHSVLHKRRRRERVEERVPILPDWECACSRTSPSGLSLSSPRLGQPTHIDSTTPIIMDTQLRDEAAQDRIRAAKEFLDPSKSQDFAIMGGVF